MKPIKKLNRCLFLCCLFLSILYLNTAFCMDIEYYGSFVARFIDNKFRKDNPLNPDFKVFSLPEYENKIYLNFFMNLYFNENIKFVLKTRPTWIKKGNKEMAKNYLDNAYINFNLGKGLFLSIGKENLIEGVGFSYYPSNFFSEKKETDFTLKEEEQRSDREGNYIIRSELLLENVTITTVIAPEIDDLQEENTRAEFKFSALLYDTDLSISYFYSNYGRIGWNVSRVVGQKFEVHSELGLRFGSDRKYLRQKSEIGPPGSGIFEYEIYEPEDEEKVFLRGLIGGHYTSANKTNYIVEYFYNQDGYDENEWKEFFAIIKDNSNKLISPPNGFSEDLFKFNLSLANSLMTYRYLRQHYLFARIWNPEVYNRFDVTWGILLNLEDKSFVILPTADYKLIRDFVILRFGAAVFNGDGESEFGLSPMKNYYYFEMRFFF